MSTSPNRRILLIDDLEDIHADFRKILGGRCATPALDAAEAALFGASCAPPALCFELDSAYQGQQGVTMAAAALERALPYAMAFVDMRMPPGQDGTATIEQLWNADPALQVVICTAYSDDAWDEILERLDVRDRLLILKKPFDPIEVRQQANTLTAKWEASRQAALKMDGLQAAVQERTHQLQHQASHDALTGLPNRNLLRDRLQQALAHIHRQQGALVLCFIDLDHFKWINDSLGHAAGDEVLRVTAERIAACLREADTVARIGGDEFILLLLNPGPAQVATQAIERVVHSVGRPIALGGKEITVTCSVGCSRYPDDGGDADELLKFADAAMYRAKQAGRNNMQVYNVDLHRHLEEQIKIESALRQAITLGQLTIHYQPQIDLRSGIMSGVEALLRWQHPELGNIAPARFIPLAEECGLIEAIGAWVIDGVCRQIRQWQDAGVPAPCVAVNVSAKQLARPGLAAHVARCIDAYGIDAGCLELELAESTAMLDLEKTITLMLELKRIGVRLAIDDFGTSYSNLRALARLPLDKLKLDGSFVKDIVGDPRALVIANMIVTTARQLGLKIVAEMAETEGQVALLASCDCDAVQGYYFSPALAPADCARLIGSGALVVPGAAAKVP